MTVVLNAIRPGGFGSTAKLRTLAHYLEVIALLYREFAPLSAEVLAEQTGQDHDPLSSWVAKTLGREPDLTLDSIIHKALGRRYSASPYQKFFTGGGVHIFHNFSARGNRRRMSVREAFRRSNNLVFIRLMRDLARFHQARLPYDAQAVLSQPDHPTRRRFLKAIANEETKTILFKAYRTYHGLSVDALIARLLGQRAQSPRHLAILFFAWHDNPDEEALATWLQQRLGEPLPADQVQRLWRAYSTPRLTLADYSYLLSRHVLTVWCTEELVRKPQASWQDVFKRSHEARRLASAWLFKARRAQQVRLRTRIEQDAFTRMTPYWQRLGFPFKRLVPSYATALGSSSDRSAERRTLTVSGEQPCAGQPHRVRDVAAASEPKA